MTDSDRGSGSGVTGSACDAGPEAARAGAPWARAVAAEAAEPAPVAVAVAAPSEDAPAAPAAVAAGLTGAPVGLVSACRSATVGRSAGWGLKQRCTVSTNAVGKFAGREGGSDRPLG